MENSQLQDSYLASTSSMEEEGDFEVKIEV